MDAKAVDASRSYDGGQACDTVFKWKYVAERVGRHCRSRNSRHLYTRYSFVARTTFNALLNKNQSTGEGQLKDTFKQLQWRVTSRPCDEAVCLASIARLDLPEDDLDARMIELLRLLGTIPLVLIFQAPARLNRKGFRWAPKSFINAFRRVPTNLFRTIYGSGEIGPNREGLIITRPGFNLYFDEGQPFEIGKTFILDIPSVGTRKVEC